MTSDRIETICFLAYILCGMITTTSFVIYWHNWASADFKKSYPLDKPREFDLGMMFIMWPLYVALFTLYYIYVGREKDAP